MSEEQWEFTIWAGIVGFALFLLVAFGIYHVKTDQDELKCLAKGGEPMQIRSKGVVCFKKDLFL